MKGVVPFLRSLRTLRTLLSMLLLCALAGGAAAQPAVRVTTAGQGGTITVAASAEMAVEAGTAWTSSPTTTTWPNSFPTCKARA
jgi:hypothetical protein